MSSWYITNQNWSFEFSVKILVKMNGVLRYVALMKTNFHGIFSKNIMPLDLVCNYQTPSSAQCLKITEKVSFNIASEASYVYILSGQK